MITVTRRYRFSAAHVLARSDWSPERNRAVYGKCGNPAGHGHNYVLDVTVRGQVDPQTGRVIPIEHLDRVVHERVLAPLDHRWLDREIPEFAAEVPTAENIARFVWRMLKGEISPAALHHVRLQETENNSVGYGGEDE
jgi:6-pyruvoyltetrahydropterin/6-carboxytetrahydropterin synthase